MGLIIGMDEAGYGPNIGPLVVSVTVWEVPGHPRETDLHAAMADVVTGALPSGSRLTREPDCESPARRLHVADSKRVYNPTRGIANLERSVLCALSLCGMYPAGFRELRRSLAASDELSNSSEPWLDGRDLRLPLAEHPLRFEPIVDRWRDCCRRSGIRLVSIRSDAVLTRRFNRLTRASGSKGLTLSRISLRLLRSVWDPQTAGPALIVADKHGGRNRYDRLLAEVLDGRMIFRGTESTARSDYRVSDTSLRFESGAEAHLPVALASMVSKYVRELAMTLFNRFWREQLPDLKPTAGYPVDARRFKAEIAETQAALGIDDEILWRER